MSDLSSAPGFGADPIFLPISLSARCPAFHKWESVGKSGSSATGSDDCGSSDFDEGFAAGRAAAEAEFLPERQALTELAANLSIFRPEPSPALASLIAETVGRLVRQIVGEVKPDPSLMRTRTQAVADLITDVCQPAKLCLHPDDIKRLASVDFGFEIVADASLLPGTIAAHTANGAIEDGTQIGLDRLRTLLDGLGIGR
jgi:flagellar assembly protein FliH